MIKLQLNQHLSRDMIKLQLNQHLSRDKNVVSRDKDVV